MNSPIDPAIVMPDVQSSTDTRHIPIQRVGIRGVRHPMLVEGADGSPQGTVANWTLTVALPPEEKGTHMSRFVALLEKYRSTPMTPKLFRQMAADMLPLLHAERGDITAAFPYFINKSAPISGVQSLLDYEVQWIARAQGDSVEFELIVQVPVTSLCPCSKAISEYGAHNQRSHVTVSAILGSDISMDGVIRLIEDEGSCELWGLLKRPDEVRHRTRLRQSQVRRGPGARRGRPPERAPRHRPLPRRGRELRIHPQPLGLRRGRRLIPP